MQLIGKIIIKGQIIAETGLHIGGSKAALEIGGVDKGVVKNGDGKPYIPGSSLKGKLRSLLAKKVGAIGFESPKERNGNKKSGDNKTYDDDTYIADIFGVAAGRSEKQSYTRLYVRDATLIKDSIDNLKEDSIYEMEFEYSDVKWENRIDRKTGAAEYGGLRQLERVPKGAEFQFEIVYDIYSDWNKIIPNKLYRDRSVLNKHLEALGDAMELLQDDYLGGQGSRGYGKISFQTINKDIKLKLLTNSGYLELGDIKEAKDITSFADIITAFKSFRERVVKLSDSSLTLNLDEEE